MPTEVEILACSRMRQHRILWRGNVPDLLDHEGEWAPPAGYVPGR